MRVDRARLEADALEADAIEAADQAGRVRAEGEACSPTAPDCTLISARMKKLCMIVERTFLRRTSPP